MQVMLILNRVQEIQYPSGWALNQVQGDGLVSNNFQHRSWARER